MNGSDITSNSREFNMHFGHFPCQVWWAKQPNTKSLLRFFRNKIIPWTGWGSQPLNGHVAVLKESDTGIDLLVM